MSTEKVFKISFKWAVSIVVGALLTGMVGGAFGLVGILNSDHFTVLALDTKVKEIESTYVRKDVNDLEHRMIEQKLDTILRHFNLMVEIKQ
jgi:hypothetical protein